MRLLQLILFLWLFWGTIPCSMRNTGHCTITLFLVLALIFYPLTYSHFCFAISTKRFGRIESCAGHWQWMEPSLRSCRTNAASVPERNSASDELLLFLHWGVEAKDNVANPAREDNDGGPEPAWIATRAPWYATSNVLGLGLGWLIRNMRLACDLVPGEKISSFQRHRQIGLIWCPGNISNDSSSGHLTVSSRAQCI